MSGEHSPARAKGSSGAGLNLLKGAPAIAQYLGPGFSPRIIRYLHETKKLTSIFQFGKTGPLCARLIGSTRRSANSNVAAQPAAAGAER
jgi:hypothetical protein